MKWKGGGRWLLLAGLLGVRLGASAQQQTTLAAQPLDSLVQLRGMVLDSAHGHPIVGATVVVKGKNVGVATDSSGKFSLLLPFGECDLAISSLGFATRPYHIDKADFGYRKQYFEPPTFYLLSGKKDLVMIVGSVGPAGPADKAETFAKVQVYFATDRQAEKTAGALTDFGTTRGRGVSYGTALVTIPGIHKKGGMERPGFFGREDPQVDVVLQSNQVLANATFFEQLRAQVARSAQPAAFVFVHGYNVSYAEAARRTAQMHYDLKFPGVPMFFSWPSQAAVESYVVDEQNAEWAQDDFKTFLVDFLTRTNAQQVYIIAHSMGNRLVARAVRDLVLERPLLAAKVQELILAAPDIDAAVFNRNIAPVLARSRIHTTLYASSGDKALKASRLAHGRYARLGLVDAQVPYTMRGMETIVASEADPEALGLNFGLGHSYIADVPLVLTDLGGLIVGRKRPDQRPSLTKVSVGGKSYWNLKPGK
ncbi:alpha/beta hydrolase [Microvirga sp. STS02]|uniref:alpha/beta hydrolase n=1 Tax=Hymenobacter negativus TaxID=2795026 RepID=UPI0018DDEDBD|nr:MULTISPECIES: alpha/beta hydrolase [Bacteria]MBH8569228.1 alpha/beta hydrolase [Hymenobacter negativus]MBR7208963.1 alpha/beta hydrolase [Microvirga sp. STS02]